MKKLLMTLILIGSIVLSANAQMIIKPAIGLNFTHLSGDPLTHEQTGRLGWQIGGSLSFGDEFYLEPGIFWMKNNWELQELAANTKLKNDISSIRIPVYVGWNVVGDPDDDRNFHIFAGPSAMVVTKTNTETTDLTADDFNKFILGANIGAGLSIGKIFVDVGYEWGLNDLYKDDPNNVKSKALWINAGFRLTFL